MTTTTLSAAQSGSETTGSGVWTSSATPPVGLGMVVAYVQFDFSDLRRQLPSQLVLGFTPSGSKTLTIDSLAVVDLADETTFDNGGAFYTLDDFSNSNLPSSHKFATTGTVATEAVTATATTVTIDLAPTDVYTPLADSLRALLTRGQADYGGWTGRLAFRFAGAGAPITLGSFSLAVTHQRDLTGLDGRAGMSRADECPKCGTVGLREDWVRDGYTGLWVCPGCWDPPDLTGRVRRVREREVNP